MSTVPMSTNASFRDRSKAPGDHGFVIAFGFGALVWICLAAGGFYFLPQPPPVETLVPIAGAI